MRLFLLRAMTLQTKLTLLIFTLFCFVIFSFGILFISILTDSIEKEVGNRALSVAETVTIPSFPFKRYSILRIPRKQYRATRRGIEKEIWCSVSLSLGNKDSIRYSHPSVDEVGQTMVGGDNDLALLEGQSYVSRSEGTLGPSIRGKGPYFE